MTLDTKHPLGGVDGVQPAPIKREGPLVETDGKPLVDPAALDPIGVGYLAARRKAMAQAQGGKGGMIPGSPTPGTQKGEGKVIARDPQRFQTIREK